MPDEKLRQEVYKDLLQPSARELWKILQTITKTGRFVFAGFDYLASKQDRWQKFLENVASKVDEGNLVEAQPQIAGPIIEGMIFTDEKSLIGEMFAELLAKSIDKTQQDKAHPAFPKIIQQLSHDEAVIMFYLKKQAYKVDQQWDLAVDKITNMRTIKEDFPVDKLIYPDNIWMYMDHLNSLTIAGTWKIKNDDPIIVSGRQIGGYTRSERKLSEFGKLFSSACVPDKFEGI